MAVMGDMKNNTSAHKLRELIHSILSKTSRTTKLINGLEEIIKYKDVLFYTWKTLMKMVRVTIHSSDTFMLNILGLLEKISIPKSYLSEERKDAEEEILGLYQGTNKFILDIPLLKRYIKKVWQSLINRDLSPVAHRKLLLVLLESYLPCLDNPIFLTDYLMASINMKGVIGILALQGVAMLMQKHNIEYSNIYKKLYTMFEPHIFHSKYKSRLFYLANIFLSSTHLPEILVASFIKRISRLSLTCGAPDVIIILRFVGNLFLRHTGLKKMIHYHCSQEVKEDPFLENEKDPMKTRATESSLWEFSLLNNHCQPSISSAAKFIHFNLPSLEFDLSKVLENSYPHIFESECKGKKHQKPSLTFQRPQETVAKLKDDRTFKLWSLTT